MVVAVRLILGNIPFLSISIPHQTLNSKSIHTSFAGTVIDVARLPNNAADTTDVDNTPVALPNHDLNCCP